VFQEDCFELDHDAFPTEIFKSSRQQDLAHSNLLVFKDFFFLCVLQQINQDSKIYLHIFDSVLKIFIMSSNREVSICDNMRKIFSTMTKEKSWFFWCVCVFCW